MQIKVKAGNITKIKAGAIVAGILEGSKKPEGTLAIMDQTLSGAISQLMKQGQVKGKLGESIIFHTLGKLPAEFVVIVGLGKKADITADRVRGIAGELCRSLRQKYIEIIAAPALGTGLAGITLEDAAQAMAEGAVMGLYTFHKHITKQPEYGEIRELIIIADKEADVPKLRRGIERGRIMAQAANLARDMANEPSNYMTPTDMAKMSQKIAKEYGLELTTLEKEDMAKLGMGGVLGVSQGSSQPPKFIILKYSGRQAKMVDLALIGKGVTFDSGGISLKPADKMEEMKGDMSGAASVMAAMSGIAQLKPRLNIVAIVAAVENLPSGHAYKPGDVVKVMNGKTIEVISTDAEGRLTLADALSYVNSKIKASHVVDVATLTGACVIALGHVCSGAFGNNQELVDKVISAGKRAGELIWQMPMFEEYKEQNKSEVADIKNVGGRPGGAITAAQFLAEFAGNTPWVHLDIAGTDLAEKEHKYYVKGATGIPVRTLINLTLDMAKG